jgi:hypothetical protein
VGNFQVKTGNKIMKEEICNWKTYSVYVGFKINKNLDFVETSCKRNDSFEFNRFEKQYFHDEYKFCPYCGKKIERIIEAEFDEVKEMEK